LRLTCLIAGANLRRSIAEFLQPALNLRTTADSSAFQLPSQFYPSTPEIRSAKRTRRPPRICRGARKNCGERRRAFRRIYKTPVCAACLGGLPPV